MVPRVPLEKGERGSAASGHRHQLQHMRCKYCRRRHHHQWGGRGICLLARVKFNKEYNMQAHHEAYVRRTETEREIAESALNYYRSLRHDAEASALCRNLTDAGDYAESDMLEASEPRATRVDLFERATLQERTASAVPALARGARKQWQTSTFSLINISICPKLSVRQRNMCMRARILTPGCSSVA